MAWAYKNQRSVVADRAEQSTHEDQRWVDSFKILRSTIEPCRELGAHRSFAQRYPVLPGELANEGQQGDRLRPDWHRSSGCGLRHGVEWHCDAGRGAQVDSGTRFRPLQEWVVRDRRDRRMSGEHCMAYESIDFLRPIINEAVGIADQPAFTKDGW